MNVKEMLECHKLLESEKPDKNDPDFEKWEELMRASWKLILEQRKKELTT